MHRLHLYRILFCLLGCGLIFLLAACGSGNPPSASSTPTTKPTTVHGGPTPGVTPTLSGGNPPTGGTVSMPSTQTSCPLPLGTGRAAVMANLQLGSHQNVVYVYNMGNSSSSSSLLKRHDLTTGSDSVIARLPGITITSAQLSANGQWILFVAIAGGQGKLQMIRMDGQGLQTLYCAPSEGTNISSTLSNVQWSTNQRLVVFDHFSSSSFNHYQVYLLSMTSGSVQLELSTGTFYAPITWLDTTRVYLSRQFTDSPPDSLYLLDTKRGANQPESNLALVFRANNSNNQACWSADSSFDGATAFISQCSRPSSTSHPGAGAQEGPSNILIQQATGGASHPLYANSSEAITVVRAISRTTLLFTVDDEAFDPGISVDNSHNGLWKINTDGSGATRLATTGSLNADTQFPWSNVSRDGNLYSLQVTNGNTQSLQFGPLSGGSTTTFATTTTGSLTGLEIVGWTTM